MIVFFFMAVIVVWFVEGIPLIKKRLWRELGTISFLIGIAVFLGIAKQMNMSTVQWLQQLLGPVGEAILKQQ